MSPIAIAVTMVMYSFYSTIANTHQLRILIMYSYREQLQDVAKTIIITMVMCALIFPIKYLIANKLLLLFLQIVSGGVLYIIFSIAFKVEAMEYIKAIFIHIKNRQH